ncbi:hypothetical protein U1Q18_030744 [Sarracenia purpurea var. burkii]
MDNLSIGGPLHTKGRAKVMVSCHYGRVVFQSSFFLGLSSPSSGAWIPIIGGKDLDLHRLFVEVTSRGGIEKILRERRWKEVTAVFSFPSTATNASFVLRKYYVSLLYHYEQIYFFKAKGWSPSADPFQTLSSPPVPPQVLAESVQPSLGIQAAEQPQRTNVTEFSPGATPVPSTGSPVIGVIDGNLKVGMLLPSQLAWRS